MHSKLKISLNQVFDFIKDMVLINLGMAVYSLGRAIFTLPNRSTTGGGAAVSASIQ